MAFGVFPIFNFYQQPNSGATGGPLPEITTENSGVIFGENGKSGTIADFNWYYPYAGTNYDLFLLKAAKEYHRMESYADAFESGVGSITPISLFSGKFRADGDRTSLTTSWEGFISPQNLDWLNWNSAFSGLVTGNPAPKLEFLYLFSGKMSGQNYDAPTISSTLSGSLKATGDRCFINSQYSGIISGIVPDTQTWFTAFSGKIIPLSSDIASLSYEFNSFGTGRNARIQIRSGQSEASISYSISEITIVS